MNAPTAPELLSAVGHELVERGATGRIVDVAAGNELLYVEIETPEGTREAGVVYLPDGEIPDATGRDAMKVAMKATEPSADRGLRAVGIGALNALSRPYVDWRAGDPMNALAESVEVVAMVGLFGPVLDRFGTREIRVIERCPDEVSLPEGLPDDANVSLHGPDEADHVLADAEVLYLTGSALVFGGIERSLEAAGPEQTVVLIGATASFLPDPAFETGVTVVAGADVRDRERVREGVVATAREFQLHGNGLEKVYTTPESVDPDHVRLG
jgi:uncharacterized protein (DUF4213/DUF364 family)